jgi:hypothetical protein
MLAYDVAVPGILSIWANATPGALRSMICHTTVPDPADQARLICDDETAVAVSEPGAPGLGSFGVLAFAVFE